MNSIRPCYSRCCYYLWRGRARIFRHMRRINLWANFVGLCISTTATAKLKWRIYFLVLCSVIYIVEGQWLLINIPFLVSCGRGGSVMDIALEMCKCSLIIIFESDLGRTKDSTLLQLQYSGNYLSELNVNSISLPVGCKTNQHTYTHCIVQLLDH